MTVVMSNDNIAIRKVLNEYNGAFNGSTHSIDNEAFVHVFMGKNVKQRIVLPFKFKTYNVKVTSFLNLLKVQLD